MVLPGAPLLSLDAIPATHLPRPLLHQTPFSFSRGYFLRVFYPFGFYSFSRTNIFLGLSFTKFFITRFSFFPCNSLLVFYSFPSTNIFRFFIFFPNHSIHVLLFFRDTIFWFYIFTRVSIHVCFYTFSHMITQTLGIMMGYHFLYYVVVDKRGRLFLSGGRM